MYYGKYCQYRDAKGLTDYQVARATDLPTAMFTEWKHSEEEHARPGYTPKTDKLFRIARFLDVTVDDLIAEELENEDFRTKD